MFTGILVHFSLVSRLLPGALASISGLPLEAGEELTKKADAETLRPAIVHSATASEGPDMWNLPSSTFGGRQLWGDELHFRGWRIQTNVYTRHSRLLDSADCRHASGTLEHCKQTLKQIQVQRHLAPLTGRAVIFIHGIVRSSHSFDTMKSQIAASGCEVVGFDYPSTRVPLEDSAEYLHRTIDSLEGIEQIDFVVHSMGGLLVRQYLAKHRDPRLRRMVMLGVPNHGANLANMLKDFPIFKSIYGPAGQQLVEGPEAFVAKLPTPDFPFAVIAGGKGTAAGYNPWIAGDDDGTVAVQSTRLAGAADFIQVPAGHSFLMANPTVIAATWRFLETGVLAESGAPNPIPKSPVAADTRPPGSLNSENVISPAAATTKADD